MLTIFLLLLSPVILYLVFAMTLIVLSIICDYPVFSIFSFMLMSVWLIL